MPIKFKASHSIATNGKDTIPLPRFVNTAAPAPLENTSWNLYRDGVTQGFINRFMTCREQCRLHYVEGYSIKGSSIWFDFGNLVHDVLSRIYAEHTPPSPGTLLCLIKAYQEKREKLNANSMTNYDWEQQEIIYGVAEAMLPIYVEKYREDWNNNWVYNETTFSVPYRFRDGRATTIRGRIDGGFYKPVSEGENENAEEYGKLVLLDTKNLSVIDEEIIYASLPFDTQCMLYLWAVKRMVEEKNQKRRQRGIKQMNPLPSEFIYNVIRRPGHRRKKDEAIKDFVSRVNTDIFKEVDHYLIRFKMKVTKGELDYWEKHQLIPVMEQIQAWWNAGCSGDLHWMNPQGLQSKYGKCDLFDLITKGDKTRYVKKTVPFPELIDDPDNMPAFKPAILEDGPKPIVVKPVEPKIVEDL